MKSTSLIQTFGTIAIALIFALVSACDKDQKLDNTSQDGSTSETTATNSEKDSEDDKHNQTQVLIAEDVPQDSQGEHGSANIIFSTHIGNPGAALTTMLALDVSDKITIDTAKLNISSIKLKAESSPSPQEDELEESLDEIIKDNKSKEKEKLANLNKDLDELKAKGDKSKKNSDRIKSIKEDIAKTNDLGESKAAQKEFDSDKNLQTKDDFLYDLISQTSTPEIPGFDLTDGTYKRCEFKLKPNRHLSGENPMLNNSILVTGTFDGTPFELNFPFNEHIRMSGEQGIAIQGSSGIEINIQLDIASWFEGVNFESADRNESGEIIISNSSNHRSLMKIRQNINNSAMFGHDVDGDGKLTDEEIGGNSNDQ